MAISSPPIGNNIFDDIKSKVSKKLLPKNTETFPKRLALSADNVAKEPINSIMIALTITAVLLLKFFSSTK